MLAQDSRLLLDYSEYIEKNKNKFDMNNFKEIKKVQSIFYSSFYDSPYTWMHVKGDSDEKITGFSHC